MFLSVNLRAAGHKLPSLGAYRSVNCLVGLFLDVSWITNNYGGSRKCQWSFYPAQHSYENSFALDLRQNVNILNICFTTFGRLATLMVNISRGFQFVRPNQGCYTFLFLIASQPARQIEIRKETNINWKRGVGSLTNRNWKRDRSDTTKRSLSRSNIMSFRSQINMNSHNFRSDNIIRQFRKSEILNVRATVFFIFYQLNSRLSMANGSWLMALGSGLTAHVSWLMAHYSWPRKRGATGLAPRAPCPVFLGH